MILCRNRIIPKVVDQSDILPGTHRSISPINILLTINQLNEYFLIVSKDSSSYSFIHVNLHKANIKDLSVVACFGWSPFRMLPQ